MAATAVVTYLGGVLPAAAQVADIEDLFGAAPLTREVLCTRTACRPATTVRLRKDESHDWQVEIPSGPYALDGRVSILPGEHMRLVAKIHSKMLVDVERTLADVDASLIELEFAQEPASQSGVGMRFGISNPFDAPLGFEAVVFAPDRGTDYTPADTCVVGPRQSAVIRWPVPVFELRIQEFYIADADEGRPCEAPLHAGGDHEDAPEIPH